MYGRALAVRAAIARVQGAPASPAAAASASPPPTRSGRVVVELSDNEEEEEEEDTNVRPPDSNSGRADILLPPPALGFAAASAPRSASRRRRRETTPEPEPRHTGGAAVAHRSRARSPSPSYSPNSPMAAAAAADGPSYSPTSPHLFTDSHLDFDLDLSAPAPAAAAASRPRPAQPSAAAPEYLDAEALEGDSEQFVCVLCSRVPRNVAFVNACSHVMCVACFEADCAGPAKECNPPRYKLYHAGSDVNASYTCPMHECGANNIQHFTQHNGFLEGQIAARRAKCPHCADFVQLGRGWANYTRHTESECKKRLESCKHCTTFRDTPERLAKHVKDECPRAPVACHFCRATMTREHFLLEHISIDRTTCIDMMPCPNGCTGKDVIKAADPDFWAGLSEAERVAYKRVYKISHKELAAHTADKCPRRQVSCTVVGCNTKVQARQLAAHLAQDTGAHLVLMSKELARMHALYDIDKVLDEFPFGRSFRRCFSAVLEVSEEAIRHRRSHTSTVAVHGMDGNLQSTTLALQGLSRVSHCLRLQLRFGDASDAPRKYGVRVRLCPMASADALETMDYACIRPIPAGLPGTLLALVEPARVDQDYESLICNSSALSDFLLIPGKAATYVVGGKLLFFVELFQLRDPYAAAAAAADEDL